MTSAHNARCAFLPPPPRAFTLGATHSSVRALDAARSAARTMRRPRRARGASVRCTVEPRAPPGHAPPGKTQEYWANVGSVIDALREDYPRLPDAEPSLALYSSAVTLRSRAGVICQGRAAYRGVLWLARAQLRMCFTMRSLAVMGIYFDRAAAQVYVRWRLTGVSRVSAARSPAYVYDGLSLYTLDDNGCIRDHLLDNIVRIRRPLRPLFDSVLAAAVAGRPSPAPVGVPVCFGAAVTVPPWCVLRKGEIVPRAACFAIGGIAPDAIWDEERQTGDEELGEEGNFVVSLAATF